MSNNPLEDLQNRINAAAARQEVIGDSEASASISANKAAEAKTESLQAAADAAESLTKTLQSETAAKGFAEAAEASAQEAKTDTQAIQDELTQHIEDTEHHLTDQRSEDLNYLITNYGPHPITPIPQPSTPGEGSFTYLSDDDLAMLVSEGRRQQVEGQNYKVYGCLFPFYQQQPNTTTGAWASRECEPDLLPAWCNGTPWLFDCLKADGTPRKWRPSTADSAEIDEYQGEYLWTWWNCNYIRCNNGNRRIIAVEGKHDNYAETGDIDVGVMYAKRYCYFGEVTMPDKNNINRIYTLVVIASGPMEDPKFPSDIKAKLLEMGVSTLTPFCECKRWNDDGTEVIAPYGLHSKYFSVLAGSTASNCKPRSQKGHLLTNITHNQHVTGAGVQTDNASGNKGEVNYTSKGIGYKGSGMDRTLFLIMHLMIKGGSKNLQKYMTGFVTDINGQAAVTVPINESVANTKFVLEAPNSSVLIAAGSESAFPVNSFIAVGNGSRDRTGTYILSGRVKGYAYHVDPDDASKTYTEIIIDPWYKAKTSLYTTSHKVIKEIPASGTTDVLPGHYDGAPYERGIKYDESGNPTSTTIADASPCRLMGTEYGIGAFHIYLDATWLCNSDKSSTLYHATPQTVRQTEKQTIIENYNNAGTFGRAISSGTWYTADIKADVGTGTYLLMPPATANGGTTTGYGDAGYYFGSCSAGTMYAFWGYGGTCYFSGTATGLAGCYGNNNGNNNAYLTNSNWYTCSCYLKPINLNISYYKGLGQRGTRYATNTINIVLPNLERG